MVDFWIMKKPAMQLNAQNINAVIQKIGALNRRIHAQNRSNQVLNVLLHYVNMVAVLKVINVAVENIAAQNTNWKGRVDQIQTRMRLF